MYALGIILILGFSIVIHEGGHYLMMRRYGIIPREFAIFFIKVKEFTFQGTRFSIGILPLGGFVAANYEEVKNPFGEKSVIGNIIDVVVGIICLPLALLFYFHTPDGETYEEQQELQSDEKQVSIMQNAGPLAEANVAFAGPLVNLLFFCGTAFLICFFLGEDIYTKYSMKEGTAIHEICQRVLWLDAYNPIAAMYSAVVATVVLGLFLIVASAAIVVMIFTGQLMVPGNFEAVESMANDTQAISASAGGLDFWQILGGIAMLNLMLAAFNLLPIPGLDGSRIANAFMKMILPERIHTFCSGFAFAVIAPLFMGGLVVWTLFRDAYYWGGKFIHLFI